jgi:hypothetical protein
MFAQETEVSFGTNLSSSNIDVMQVNDAIINELRTKGEIVIDCKCALIQALKTTESSSSLAPKHSKSARLTSPQQS